MILVIDI